MTGLSSTASALPAADAESSRRLCVAPMMDCTDRHDRYLLRLISKRALLYTEMLTTGAVLNGDTDRLLAYDQREHPIALQLGGSEPDAMARSARIGAEFGYDEINMNVGCPSDRVRSGRFGACLMAEPVRVADCVAAMRAAVSIPVTVKTRIGIDEHDSFDHLCRFVGATAAAGCSAVIVHARKAWLSGLSPKENRTVPPLDYDRVYALKDAFADLPIVLNGGIKALDAAACHLQRVDGVMIGREAYANPFVLAEVDRRFFAAHGMPVDRYAVLREYIRYCDAQLAAGVRLHRLTRHVVGLFQGQPRARAWRRFLSENAHRPGADTGVLRRAAALVSAAPL